MSYDPRDTQDIYEDLRDSLKNRISKLTNFTERSFNYVWTQAFSDEIRDLEVNVLASNMNGFIDYVGGPVEDRDLEELGISNVSTDEVNEYMNDEYLDEFVKIVGITRFEPTKSVGEVDIRTQLAETDIPEGTVVTTSTETTGGAKRFETTRFEISEEGDSSITVPVRSVSAGEDNNVPANTITRLEDPPVGVKGVTNAQATTGGEDRESNEQLRRRAKNAIETASEAGTANGIKGAIRKEIDTVGQGDVIIEEFVENIYPPFVDVIVDIEGDTELQKVEEVIEKSRPTGVKHNLVEPQNVQLGFDTKVQGKGTDTTDIVNAIESFLLDLSIGDAFFNDALIADIMTSDEQIINIDELGGFIEKVKKEKFEYNIGQNEYRLDFTYEKENGSITITDENGDTYVEGTSNSAQFKVVDRTGDGFAETIVWNTDNSTPEIGEDFFVDYDVTVPESPPQGTHPDDYYSINLSRHERFIFTNNSDDSTYQPTDNIYQLNDVPFPETVTVVGQDGTTYENGVDFAVIDDTGNGFKQSIDWGAFNGGEPNDSEQFDIEYTQKVYTTDNNIIDSLDEEIIDESGTNYTEGTEYELDVYETASIESDVIVWNSLNSAPNTGQEFYMSYLTEGDFEFDNREKATVGTVEAQIV